MVEFKIRAIIVDPWGKILAEAGGKGASFIITDIDTDAVAEARAKIPNLKNNRPFTLATA